MIAAAITEDSATSWPCCCARCISCTKSSICVKVVKAAHVSKAMFLLMERHCEHQISCVLITERMMFDFDLRPVTGTGAVGQSQVLPIVAAFTSVHETSLPGLCHNISHAVPDRHLA